MYREILVPFDGSDLAERARSYAITLARGGHARLRLMRVVPAAQFTPIVPLAGYAVPQALGDAEKARRDAEAYLSGLVILEAGESSVETVVYAGDPALLIADEARSRSVDLIVMATHGRSGLEEWVEGSVAGAVIRDSSVPVLVIPRGCQQDWSKQNDARLLVLLDGSALSQEILGPAVDLSQVRRAEITLLRVVAPGTSADAQEYLDVIAADLRKQRPRIEARVVEANDPVTAILAVAQDQQVDAIALATHGRGGLARLLMGSFARALLHQANVPVLLYRPASILS